MPERRWLEREWYRISAWHLVLFPVSLVFGALAAGRRMLYRARWLRSYRPPVPVVVIGNITVGGTGKTPLTIWLAQRLRERDWQPGILSRGYGASANHARLVRAESTAQEVGDEPLLLARLSGSPVCVGKNRGAAAKMLLAAHPECDVLLCDDGLQHYALARDCEIAVIDSEKGFGNGLLLPAGPLRERPSRLNEVDALVCHKEPGSRANVAGRQFTMHLAGERFHNLVKPDCEVAPNYFSSKQVRAIAGIGHPERFFRHLERLGLEFSARAFPDHHAYAAKDLELDRADAVVMTEKDAVKCQSFASEKCWAVSVEAQVDPDLSLLIHRKLAKRHGPEAP
jgi:tetraacyldisaccharide 4'-kinase